MKHCFILNPAAGKSDRTTELTLKISELCTARGLDFCVEISHAAGECESLARAFAESGEECRVYACGGDGTLNEVVNGLVGYPNVAVTHFPIGSGNDFIKASSDPSAFYELEQLLDADEAVFDLIEANERFGLDICSIGIDARIGTEIATYKRLPLVSGPGAYLISTVVNVVKGIHRHYVIEIDGKVLDGEQTLICACNGRWYGSGYNPVPDAVLDDGLLDVLIVKPVSRLKVARIIGNYKTGHYRDYPELISHYRVPELTIHCDKDSKINIDGELLVAKDVTFRISRHKMRFFYPRGLSWDVRPAEDAPAKK